MTTTKKKKEGPNKPGSHEALNEQGGVHWNIEGKKGISNFAEKSGMAY